MSSLYLVNTKFFDNNSNNDGRQELLLVPLTRDPVLPTFSSSSSHQEQEEQESHNNGFLVSSFLSPRTHCRILQQDGNNEDNLSFSSFSSKNALVQSADGKSLGWIPRCCLSKVSSSSSSNTRLSSQLLFSKFNLDSIVPNAKTLLGVETSTSAATTTSNSSSSSAAALRILFGPTSSSSSSSTSAVSPSATVIPFGIDLFDFKLQKVENSNNNNNNNNSNTAASTLLTEVIPILNSEKDEGNLSPFLDATPFQQQGRNSSSSSSFSSSSSTSTAAGINSTNITSSSMMNTGNVSSSSNILPNNNSNSSSNKLPLTCKSDIRHLVAFSGKGNNSLLGKGGSGFVLLGAVRSSLPPTTANSSNKNNNDSSTNFNHEKQIAATNLTLTQLRSRVALHDEKVRKAASKLGVQFRRSSTRRAASILSSSSAQLVAVKVIPLPNFSSSKFEHLRREIVLHALTSSHPHFVRLFGAYPLYASSSSSFSSSSSILTPQIMTSIPPLLSSSSSSSSSSSYYSRVIAIALVFAWCDGSSLDKLLSAPASVPRSRTTLVLDPSPSSSSVAVSPSPFKQRKPRHHHSRRDNERQEEEEQHDFSSAARALNMNSAAEEKSCCEQQQELEDESNNENESVLSHLAPLREFEFASVCRAIVTGLDFLHTELGVAHRDIKASNILLTSYGEILIADLGIAKQVASPQSIQKSSSSSFSPSSALGTSSSSSSQHHHHHHHQTLEEHQNEKVSQQQQKVESSSVPSSPQRSFTPPPIHQQQATLCGTPLFMAPEIYARMFLYRGGNVAATQNAATTDDNQTNHNAEKLSSATSSSSPAVANSMNNNNNNNVVDLRCADLFSLGVVLRTLIFENFQDFSEEAIRSSHLDPETESMIHPSVSRDCRLLVSKLLSENPKERPSCKELLTAHFIRKYYPNNSSAETKTTSSKSSPSTPKQKTLRSKWNPSLSPALASLCISRLQPEIVEQIRLLSVSISSQPTAAAAARATSVASSNSSPSSMLAATVNIFDAEQNQQQAQYQLHHNQPLQHHQLATGGDGGLGAPSPLPRIDQQEQEQEQEQEQQNQHERGQEEENHINRNPSSSSSSSSHPNTNHAHHNLLIHQRGRRSSSEVPESSLLKQLLNGDDAESRNEGRISVLDLARQQQPSVSPSRVSFRASSSASQPSQQEQHPAPLTEESASGSSSSSAVLVHHHSISNGNSNSSQI